MRGGGVAAVCWVCVVRVSSCWCPRLRWACCCLWLLCWPLHLQTSLTCYDAHALLHALQHTRCNTHCNTCTATHALQHAHTTLRLFTNLTCYDVHALQHALQHTHCNTRTATRTHHTATEDELVKRVCDKESMCCAHTATRTAMHTLYHIV